MTASKNPRSQVLLVDTRDRPLGVEDKAAAHARPLLHRAFSVFLFHGDSMLLQRRARDKYHSGGLWSNACCSHPGPGEDVAAAARERTLEEVGLEAPLEELFQFVYYCPFAPDLYEYEYDHVFLGECKETAWKLDPEEAEEARWVPLDQLEKELVSQPQDFSVWFLAAVPRVLEEIRRRRGRE